jgi:TRAP-type C4-dicarboxylate transport system substrate-binding protein
MEWRAMTDEDVWKKINEEIQASLDREMQRIMADGALIMDYKEPTGEEILEEMQRTLYDVSHLTQEEFDRMQEKYKKWKDFK